MYLENSVALFKTILLTSLLWFPACQAYDLVIVLGAWILHFCYMCYLLESSGFCHCVLMALILVAALGDYILGHGEPDGKLCVLCLHCFRGSQGIFCLNTPTRNYSWFSHLKKMMNHP
jgi:hypothetical protein